MSTFTTDWSAEQTTGTAREADSRTLIAVVGFDGSEPSRRALEAATRLLAGRRGKIEVVWVAHLTSGVSLSADAVLEVEQGFDEIEMELSLETRKMLAHEQQWGFERRNGSVAQELLSAAAVYVDLHDDSEVLIVVGASAHLYHQVMGSVPTALVRHAKLPVLVVP